MTQREFEQMKLVDVRLRIPKSDRDRLNQLAAIRLKTVNDFLYEIVKKELDDSPELRALAELKKHEQE